MSDSQLKYQNSDTGDLEYVKGKDGAARVSLNGSKTGLTASASITRPDNATAYNALDVVSTAAGAVMEFANVGAAGDLVVILSSLMTVAVAAAPNGCVGYYLHLYNAAPTAIADGDAYNLPATDLTKYLGKITISTPSDLGDNLVAQDTGINLPVKLASTSLYGILQTIGAYTPSANVVKTITLAIAGV